MAAKKNKLCERVWSKFGEIRVFESGHVSKKGGLNYVKWSYALECLKTAFPDSDVSWREWDGLDHLLYPGGSAIVEAIITIRDGGEELVTKFPLPVMDFRNKAIKNPDAMAVNTAKMRAFVKAMAALGFGLNVYHGHEGDGVADGEAAAMTARESHIAHQKRKPVAPGGGHYRSGASCEERQGPPNPADAIKDLKKACIDEGISLVLVEDFAQAEMGMSVKELDSDKIASLKAEIMNRKDNFRKDK